MRSWRGKRTRPKNETSVSSIWAAISVKFRAGQYWRLDNLRSFDEFLEKKSSESTRKAYYPTAIHEHLPQIPKRELRLIGWTKAGN